MTIKASFLALLLTFLCSATWAQKVLTVAAYPAVDDVVRAALPSWKEKNPGVEVKVVSREFADHHLAMTTALAASSGLPDVIALEYGFLGRFAQSGGFEDLSASPYLAGQYSKGFVAYAWQQGQHPKFGQVAMPTDIGPGVMFYRLDTLQKVGLTAADLSKDWDRFIASGKLIKERLGFYLVAHARDIKDIVIRSGVKPNQGIYFDENGHSLVGTDERFLNAFRLAKQIREADLDARVNTWSNDWGEAIKRGNITVQMIGAWFGGHLQNWLAKDSIGKWRTGPIPQGGATSWGGTFYVIPKRAKEKTLAWDLIRHLTLNRAQQEMAFRDFNAFPALLAAQEGAYFEEPLDYFGGQKARVFWRETAKRITATRVFRHDAIAEEIVNSQLDLVLTRGKPVERALADAHRLIQRRGQR